MSPGQVVPAPEGDPSRAGVDDQEDTDHLARLKDPEVLKWAEEHQEDAGHGPLDWEPPHDTAG